MEINSISFSDSGKYCVCSRTNGYIELVNTETGVCVPLERVQPVFIHYMHTFDYVSDEECVV